MITVNRKWEKSGKLKGVSIATSGGEQAVITWDKRGEATLLYGHEGEKPRRYVGLATGFTMGDGNPKNCPSNVVEVRGQRLIRKTQNSLTLDGVELPEDQTVIDLNKSYMARQEKMDAEQWSEVEKLNKDQAQMRKMAVLGVLLDLQPDEVKQVVSYAAYLKNMRENG